MDLLFKVLCILYPPLLIKDSGYFLTWEKREKKAYKIFGQFVYGLITILFVIHYLINDSSNNLLTSLFWQEYRLVIFSTLALTIVYLKFFPDWKYFKFPVFISMSLVCYYQSLAIFFDSRVPWIYVTLIQFFAILTLKMTLLFSAFVLAIIYMIQHDLFFENLQYKNHLIQYEFLTSYFVIFSLLFAIKLSDYYKVESFLSDIKKMQDNKKFIESQKELNEQLSYFLPPVIYSRIMEYKVNHRVSYRIASEEVLKPRFKNVVCVWTDIRGYSSLSKNSHMILDSAFPNIKALTNIVNLHGGIPRLIGDLILAYFDDENFQNNVKNGLSAAFAMMYENEYFKSNLSKNISRHVIIGSGPSYVGNIGSDECREITVMGSCVNKLARIDDLISKKNSKHLFEQTKVIASSDIISFLEPHQNFFCVEPVNLLENDLKIRDFENEKFIYTLNPIKKGNEDEYDKIA